MGVTVAQAASTMGVSEKTIRRRIKSGALQAQLVGDPAHYEIDTALLDFGHYTSTPRAGEINGAAANGGHRLDFGQDTSTPRAGKAHDPAVNGGHRVDNGQDTSTHRAEKAHDPAANGGHRQDNGQDTSTPWTDETAGPAADGGQPVDNGKQDVYQEMIGTLTSQLVEKDRQINELHILLQMAQEQAGRALAAPRRARRWWWPFG